MGGIFAETDMESLTGLARDNRVDLKVLNAAREVNVDLANRLMQKVAAAIDSVQNKDVGILGLSFKPNTNSVAGSASIQLAQNLLAGGARVRTYDPVAMPDAQLQLNGMVKYCESAYGVAEGVDALIVATGWPEFRTLDFARIRHLVKRPIIIDTKNLLDSSRLRAMGFQYMGVGRP
jgi:UDPglucose 6-dehydrogenase